MDTLWDVLVSAKKISVNTPEFRLCLSQLLRKAHVHRQRLVADCNDRGIRVPGDIETFHYVAFEITDTGEVVQMFPPRRAENRDHAIRAAQALAETYSGAAAWRVPAASAGNGQASELLFSHGAVGPLEDAP